MRVLITGSAGQLGYELNRVAPEEGVELILCDKEEIDLTSEDSIRARIDSEEPNVVINAAAYTAVDNAESDEANAFAVNSRGPELLAETCARNNVRLVHVSTDFVFSRRHSHIIAEDAETDPLGVYARSKEVGEKRVLHATDGRAHIVRTSWLYSAHGGNFVKSMIRLMNEREELGIVADQIGTPTWANTTASTIWKLVLSETSPGLWHCSDAGVASWFDFAVAIFKEASERGLISSECEIRPIRTEDYPTPAPRPSFSVLDCTKARQAGLLGGRHWTESLRMMLDELADQHAVAAASAR